MHKCGSIPPADGLGMIETVEIGALKLRSNATIVPAYRKALTNERST